MSAPATASLPGAPASVAQIEATFRGRLRRASYVPLVVMLAFAVVLAATVEMLLSRARWVDHTHAVIAQANQCLLQAVDAEVALRTYQISGDATQVPLPAAVEADWARLEELVADNPPQQERARELHRRVAAFVAAVREVATRPPEARVGGRRDLDPDLERSFAVIRSGFRRVIGEEQHLLEERTLTLATGSRTDTAVRFAGAAVIGIALALFIRGQLQRISDDYGAALAEVEQVAGALRTSEEEYRRLNVELEQRVAERTRELSEANERLREVDRLKSEFLATMSHELRTPLNSILGFGEILHAGLAGPINDEQRNQLGMVLNAGRHLLGLINDVLDLARIESGRFDIVRETFEVRELLDRVVETVRPLAEQKQLAIGIELSGDLRLYSDRKKVFQILLNLAGNAVKFTERGSVRFVARRSGDMAIIDVVDTGVGISPDNVSILFEAFRQIDGSARRRVEGTGLGLHLSRRLARLLGGDVTVRSTFDQGSTFTLTLPTGRMA